MTEEKLAWFYDNEKKFGENAKEIILMELENASDEIFYKLCNTKLKNPTVTLLLAIAFGTFGLDRFYLKSVGVGLLKLFTVGCLFVLWFVDIFSASKRTIMYNNKKVLEILDSNYTSEIYSKDYANTSKAVQKTTDTMIKVLDAVDKHNEEIRYTKPH